MAHSATPHHLLLPDTELSSEGAVQSSRLCKHLSPVSVVSLKPCHVSCTTEWTRFVVARLAPWADVDSIMLEHRRLAEQVGKILRSRRLFAQRTLPMIRLIPVSAAGLAPANALGHASESASRLN